MKTYEYESDLDILYIKNYSKNEKVYTNLVFGNIVIDFSEKGKVLGVEIDCASKFFNLSPEQLKNLNVAKVKVISMGNTLSLAVVIGILQIEKTFSLVIPSNSQNVPIASCPVIACP